MIFGAFSVLTIWTALVFCLSQIRNQRPLTTVHILVSGALIVAGVGGIMGVLLG